MKAITLRNVPADLMRVIQRHARRRGLSLNRAVIDLLERSLGRGSRRRRQSEYRDLDPLAGTWDREDAAAFERALDEQRAIDRDLWR